MSPLRVEAFNSEINSWVRVGEVGPADYPGSVSSNLPDGRRGVYEFSCSPDDLYSKILKLAVGIDTEIGRFRMPDVGSVLNAETIATLRKGDPPYILTVKTDISPVGRIVRFTHV